LCPWLICSCLKKKDCTKCDVVGISGEELTLDLKDNGKRFPCDDSPDNTGCKRAKRNNNTDSFQGSPFSGLIYKNIPLLFCLTFTPLNMSYAVLIAAVWFIIR
jgi:hypothetical protein